MNRQGDKHSATNMGQKGEVSISWQDFNMKMNADSKPTFVQKTMNHQVSKANQGAIKDRQDDTFIDHDVREVKPCAHRLPVMADDDQPTFDVPDIPEHTVVASQDDRHMDAVDWIRESRSRVTRCKVLLQAIVDLANIQENLSARTLHSMQQEWQELDFCESNSFKPLHWPDIVSAVMKSVEPSKYSSADDGNEDESVEEQVRHAVRDLTDFYQLFLQIHMIMQLCCDKPQQTGAGKFRILLRKIMQKGIGQQINARQNYVYEVRD
jgi:hypothetical protein